MFNEKNLLASKTVQGILVFLVGFAISKDWIPQVNAEALADELAVFLGSIYALYGRFATKGEKLRIK